MVHRLSLHRESELPFNWLWNWTTNAGAHQSACDKKVKERAAVEIVCRGPSSYVILRLDIFDAVQFRWFANCSNSSFCKWWKSLTTTYQTIIYKRVLVETGRQRQSIICRTMICNWYLLANHRNTFSTICRSTIYPRALRLTLRPLQKTPCH